MSHIESFKMQELHRSELKKHPLNPRKITAEAKRRLKAGLERFGLVQPLVFNARTGLLVGGHQRLACLDDIHEGKDYTLNVAVVDVDDAKEKELVVFLNNTSSMGFWDDDSLLEIINAEDIDKMSLGFNASELSYFDKLMAEASQQELASLNYMQDMAREADLLEESAIEKADEIETDKQTKREKWEQTVSQFFEPPPLQTGANAKKDEELTEEELEHRKAFRESRESWKKQEGSSEVVVKIVFSRVENARKWLASKGMPTTQFLLHEKEIF